MIICGSGIQKYFDFSLVLGPGLVGIALFSGFLLLVIAGTTNAVNLTDGLDGLAAGAGAIALLVYTAIAFMERQYDVALICGAMVGAIVGFLGTTRIRRTSLWATRARSPSGASSPPRRC